MDNDVWLLGFFFFYFHKIYKGMGNELFFTSQPSQSVVVWFL